MFGQVAADRAVAVLVAAAPALRVRGGEVGGHAEPFAQFRVAGELGAVVVRDAGPGPGRQRGEHEELHSDAFAGGLVGHDARHKETRAPFDLGVRVASHADDAVGLPLAEPGTVEWPVGPLVDGCPERYAAPGHARRRSEASRYGLRVLARRRPAFRCAGPAMWHRPVHGPVLRRSGRYGR